MLHIAGVSHRGMRSHYSADAQAGSSLDVYRTIYGRAAVEVGSKVLAKVKLRGREYRIYESLRDGIALTDSSASRVSSARSAEEPRLD